MRKNPFDRDSIVNMPLTEFPLKGCVGDVVNILCEHCLKEFHIPEKTTLIFGEIRIYESFVLDKDTTIRICCSGFREWVVLEIVGMIYFHLIEMMTKEQSKISQFLNGFKRIGRASK